MFFHCISILLIVCEILFYPLNLLTKTIVCVKYVTCFQTWYLLYHIIALYSMFCSHEITPANNVCKKTWAFYAYCLYIPNPIYTKCGLFMLIVYQPHLYKMWALLATRNTNSWFNAIRHTQNNYFALWWSHKRCGLANQLHHLWIYINNFAKKDGYTQVTFSLMAMSL